MIGRVGNGKRMDINFGGAKFLAHTRERAGAVAEEHCQLCGGFDLDRRLISHAYKMPLLDRADNQKCKPTLQPKIRPSSRVPQARDLGIPFRYLKGFMAGSPGSHSG